jgi:hypothetical protein
VCSARNNVVRIGDEQIRRRHDESYVWSRHTTSQYAMFMVGLAHTHLCLKKNSRIGQKISLHALRSRDPRIFADCHQSRRLRRRASVICLQRWSEMLAATDLKMIARWLCGW